jgi:hypothetical protein
MFNTKPSSADQFHEISDDEIAKAKSFFKLNPEKILEATARQFNTEQPLFTGAAALWETEGVPIKTVEDMLESLFWIYYVIRYIKKTPQRKITDEAVKNSIDAYAEFIAYFNSSTDAKERQKLLDFGYFKNNSVFRCASEVISSNYEHVNEMKTHKDAFVVYFALLRCIELGQVK